MQHWRAIVFTLVAVGVGSVLAGCADEERVDDEYFPRDPDEWQGMRVLRDERQAFCAGSSTCGMAMACLSDGCGPCRNDGDCAEGERCAVQHCVLAALAECTSRHDCAAGELCVLSGYTAAPRGNENMRSMCLSGEGGVESEDAIGRFERGFDGPDTGE